MRPFEKAAPKGFTLLETVIALAVLAVAIVGAMSAINFSNIELQRGQHRLYKAALADAALQSARLLPKWTIQASAIGTWTPDPSGAYFELSIDQVKPISLAESPPCNKVPLGIICREVLWTTGLPFVDAGGMVPAGVQPITRWVRVSRQGEAAVATASEVFLR